MTAAGLIVASHSLELYITTAHECPYLPERRATNLLVDPAYPMNGMVYGRLLEKGFRRSGGDVYKPCCHRCQSCVSTRIPVAEFQPDRSQRRNWKYNRDLQVVENTDGFQAEYVSLYQRYIRARHAGGGMDDDSAGSFADFILARWCPTCLVEFRLQEHLLAVAATDVLPDGLSAVYTFYDPDEGQARGIGTYALLWQIARARELGKSYVYPGYWIGESPKMNYKTRFQPIEGLIENRWVRLHHQG